MSEARTGTVASFDEAAGLGEIAERDGPDCFAFHCTQILDGTRTIAPGTEVTFRTVTARHGRWEAIEVAPLTCPPA